MDFDIEFKISLIEMNIHLTSSFSLEAHHPSTDICYNKSFFLKITQDQVSTIGFYSGYLFSTIILD